MRNRAAEGLRERVSRCSVVASERHRQQVIGILFCVLSLMTFGAREARGAECHIEGLVLDAATGEPLFSASIGVVGTDIETVSDARGAYALEVACDAPITVEARRLDYRTATRKLRVVGERDIDFVLLSASIETLEDVVVFAELPKRLELGSQAILEAKDLDRSRGQDLAEALAQIPGVVTLRSSATSKPIIRGQQGRRVLVVFDGVRHESQKWGLDHGPEIDPFAAGTITVVKGGAAIRYGPDAIGGLVLLEPPAWSEPGYHGEADQVFESNGGESTLALRLDAVETWLDGISWRVDGNIQRRRARETPDYPLDNTGGWTWNAGSRLRAEFKPLTVEVNARRYAFKNGIFSGVRLGTPGSFFAQIDRGIPQGVENFRADYDIARAFQRVTHDKVITNASYVIENVGEFEFTHGYQLDQRREFDVVRRSITAPQANFRLETKSFELVFRHDPISFGSVTELNGEIGAVSMERENIFRGLPLIPNYRDNSWGAFLLETLSRGIWRFELGARYDTARRTAFLGDNAYERQLRIGGLKEGDCDFDGEVAACPSDFDGLSLTLAGGFSPRDELAFSVELSSATRFPSIDEQYINGTSPSFPIFALGQPSLSPETTTGVVATMGLDFSWLRGDASVYFNRIADYIYFAPAFTDAGEPIVDVLISGAFPRFETEQIDALFWGGDGTLTFSPWSFPLDLTFLGSVVRGEEVGGDFLVLVPPDRLSTTLRYRFAPSSWQHDAFLSSTLTHVARQSRVDPAVDFALPPAAYTLVGAAAGATLDLGGLDFTVQMEMLNIMNVRYRDYTSRLRYFADEPGRTLILRLIQRF